MDRREYLETATIGFFTLFSSGCLSNLPIGSSEAGELGDIIVLNYDSKPHTIHILVKRQDELVHWSSHRLGAEEQELNYERLNNSWGTGNVRYTVYIRRDAKNVWKKTDLSNLPSGTAFDLDISVQMDKEISIAYSPVSGNQTDSTTNRKISHVREQTT
jgi:hypothetical protein